MTEREAAEAALLASLADETPKAARSSRCAGEISRRGDAERAATRKFIQFSATTRISGVDLGGRRLRKGAVDAVLKFAREQAGRDVPEPAGFRAAVDGIARTGGTPLGLCRRRPLLGVIHLKDVVKPDIKERFAALRAWASRP